MKTWASWRSTLMPPVTAVMVLAGASLALASPSGVGDVLRTAHRVLTVRTVASSHGHAGEHGHVGVPNGGSSGDAKGHSADPHGKPADPGSGGNGDGGSVSPR